MFKMECTVQLKMKYAAHEYFYIICISIYDGKPT